MGRLWSPKLLLLSHPLYCRPTRLKTILDSLFPPRASLCATPLLYHRRTTPSRRVDRNSRCPPWQDSYLSGDKFAGSEVSKTTSRSLTSNLQVTNAPSTMSPASRVESYNSVAWLRTGVSSGNRPMFDTKMQKIPLAFCLGPCVDRVP